MPERINQAPKPPAMLFRYRGHFGRAGGQRLRKDSIRVCHSQDHSNRTATKRLGAEVAMLRRFVTQPKLRAGNGKSRDYAASWIFQSKDHSRSKRCFVKVHGSRTVANRQPWGDRTRKQRTRGRTLDHIALLKHRSLHSERCGNRLLVFTRFSDR